MHETLKWEELAPLAELPHGYLLAESDPATYAYLDPAAARRSWRPPVRRRSFTSAPTSRSISAAAARRARPQVFAAHVNRVAAIVGTTATRPMIWDDAIQADPSILHADLRSAP